MKELFANELRTMLEAFAICAVFFVIAVLVVKYGMPRNGQLFPKSQPIEIRLMSPQAHEKRIEALEATVKKLEKRLGNQGGCGCPYCQTRKGVLDD